MCIRDRSNNPVALKILSPSLAQDAANRQKFHREERSMRQVGGGHTVGVISSGTEYVAGQMVMYIVLEYVHGCTLSQLLRTRRALSLGEALDVLLPVVDALSEVHANRYLHGDIKPVSYTHLDVYKRQMLSLSCALASRPFRWRLRSERKNTTCALHHSGNGCGARLREGASAFSSTLPHFPPPPPPRGRSFRVFIPSFAFFISTHSFYTG